MKARDILVGLAIRLAFPPFTWLFRAFYALAIRCSVRSVRAAPGVAAIYLTGSMARHESIPGLSDIDFKIFVRGPRNRAASDEIRRRFARLRRCFPVLGPPDEKGIHFIEGFAADLDRYPLLRHLFDPRVYCHRLLWGESLLERLVPPRPEGNDLRQTLLWKLKDWIEKASLLAEHPLLAPPQRRYLLYKSVADAGLVLLMADDNQRRNQGRTTVLQELATRYDGGVRETVAKLLAERAIAFRSALAETGEVWQLFLRLVGEALAALGFAPARGSASFSAGRIAAADLPAWLREALPSDAAVAEFPWRRVPLSPLDCAFFGRRLVLVTLPQSLSLAGQLRLRAAARPHAEETPVMIQESGWLRSAWCELLDHWLSPEGSDDMTALLAAGEMPPGPLAQRLQARLAAWQDQLDEILASQDLARMDRPRYLRFLFAAMACLVLRRSLDDGSFAFPSDAYGVACPFGLGPGVYNLNSEEQRAMSDERIVSGIDITSDYMAKQMGDECHNRNRAAAWCSCGRSDRACLRAALAARTSCRRSGSSTVTTTSSSTSPCRPARLPPTPAATSRDPPWWWRWPATGPSSASRSRGPGTSGSRPPHRR